ncbi:MAG: sigma-70 family RNA polymerase sigma factor [Ilumatobacter sp.]|nr:sigma-70 family RNA polymerase sigma factor [Ilumatobacter sp.]
MTTETEIQIGTSHDRGDCGETPTLCRSAPDVAWSAVVEELYRNEFAALCRLARRLVSSYTAAEEVVQEAFTRFALMASRPVQGREAAYLRSMVMNEARTALRRRQVRDRHLHRWRPEAQPGPDELCVRLDEARRVRAQVARLPRRQQQVIELRFGAELSEREIADELTISAGSVKTHSSRAIRTMREMRAGAA